MATLNLSALLLCILPYLLDIMSARIRGSMGVRLNIAIKRIIAWTGEGTDKNKITNLVISPQSTISM